MLCNLSFLVLGKGLGAFLAPGPWVQDDATDAGKGGLWNLEIRTFWLGLTCRVVL